jgi:endonuclease III
MKVVPAKYMRHAHHWLILHGRYICVARVPKCPVCPINEYCQYKAKNVIALSRALIENHGSKVPEDREALEELPGVGRKTANVVLNVAFGEPTIAVDTHIFRVSNRTGLAPGKNPLEVEKGLEKIVPGEYKLHAHHWLILHGRYTCVARKPLCPTCVVNDLCRYKDKTREITPDRTPVRKSPSRPRASG